VNRRAPRDRDTISEITITVRSGQFAALANILREKSLLNHLNRTLMHFEFPDGHIETYTVWPHDGDHKAYAQRTDLLNWSEH